jgi:hypothetical protein
MNLKRIQWEEVDWVNVPHDTDDWRAVVNTVLNLGVHRVGDVLRSETARETLVRSSCLCLHMFSR